MTSTIPVLRVQESSHVDLVTVRRGSAANVQVFAVRYDGLVVTETSWWPGVGRVRHLVCEEVAVSISTCNL